MSLIKSRKAIISYNCGLNLLRGRRPAEALCLLHNSISDLKLEYHPSLWLHMAECCIAFHIQQNYRHSIHKDYYYYKKLITKGSSRRNTVGVSTRKLLHKYSNKTKLEFDESNPYYNYLSLESAIRYLQNCLAFLSLIEEQEGKKISNDSTKGLKTSSNLYSDFRKRNDCLRQTTLLQLAYIHISLKMPDPALRVISVILEEYGHILTKQNYLILLKYQKCAQQMKKRVIST